MELKNLDLTSVTSSKKKILLWSFIALAVLAVIFFSVIYLNKVAEEGKTTKQNELIKNKEQEGLLPGIVCNFASNEEAMQKAKEEKSVAACECIKEENYKFRCQEDAQNEAYYAQARAQFKVEFCEMIKNNNQFKKTCESVVTTGIAYLKEKDPEYLANIYLQSGNYDGSIAVLKGSEKVSSLLIQALSYASKALFEHQETKLIPQAQALVEKAKTLEPNNPEVYRVEGYVFEVKPDIFKAIESYNKSLEIDANYLLALIGRAHAYNLMGDLNKALEDFQKAAELDKDKRQVAIYANLCRLQTSRDDLLDEGIRNCQTVLSLSSAGPLQKGDANQIIAHTYIRKQQYAKALIYLENARAFAPNDPNLLVSFANLYLAKEDYQKAVAEAQKAIVVDPLKTTAYFAQAQAFLKLQDYAQAETQALKGLEVIDKDPSLLIPNKPAYRQQLNYLLADIYAATGDQAKETQYKNAGDQSMKFQ